jgi:hypothetical protein
MSTGLIVEAYTAKVTAAAMQTATQKRRAYWCSAAARPPNSLASQDFHAARPINGRVYEDCDAQLPRW